MGIEWLLILTNVDQMNNARFLERIDPIDEIGYCLNRYSLKRWSKSKIGITRQGLWTTVTISDWITDRV